MEQMKFDDWIDKYIFDVLGRWPTVTLIVVALLYAIVFVNGWIPR